METDPHLATEEAGFTEAPSLVPLNGPVEPCPLLSCSTEADVVKVAQQVGFRGMEKVIATATGYNDCQRKRLIKLIEAVGAVHVGSVSASITHMVCWRFKGPKYMLAKKLGKVIVNHRWLEDCFTAGKRIREGPYTHISGESVGDLIWKATKPNPVNKGCGVASSSVAMVTQGEIKGPLPSADDWTVHGLTDMSANGGVQNRIVLNGDERITGGSTRALYDSMDEDKFWDEVMRTCPVQDKGKGKELMKASELNKVMSSDDQVAVSASSGLNCTVPQACSSKTRSCLQSKFQRKDFPVNCQDEDCRALDSERKKSKTTPSEKISYLQLLSRKRKQTPAGSLAECSTKSDFDTQTARQKLCRRLETLPEKSSAARVGLVGHLETEATGDAVSKSPSGTHEIACVICQAEARSAVEGMLGCEHTFCFPCIHKWADEMLQKLKSPSCPLCKTPFDFITVRELGKDTGDGGDIQILEERVVAVGKDVKSTVHHSFTRSADICITCGSGDTEHQLLRCNSCGDRACHTFCLDPPLTPGSTWLCNRCSASRCSFQTREAFARLFQVSPARVANNYQSPNRMSMIRNEPAEITNLGRRIGAHSLPPSRQAGFNSLDRFMIRTQELKSQRL